MAKPLSNDIRERIVRAVEGGMSRNAAAQKYDVSRRLVPFVLGGLIIIGWLQLIGEQSDYYDSAFGIAVMMVVLAIILVLALWFVAKALSKLDAARSEAEETKRITEENYRLLTDNSVSAIASHEVVVDAAGEPVDYIFLSVNPAFESQTGLRGADIIGRRVTEVIPEAKNSPLIKTYGKVALTGEPAQLEYYAPEFDKYFAIKAYSLGQGRFATSFADISERKKAEEIIREKEALLSQMLEVMPIPVFYKDTSGRYVFVNKACENMFWRKREELIGKTVFDVNPPELAKIYYEDDMKLFTGGRHFRLLFTASGQPRRSS